MEWHCFVTYLWNDPCTRSYGGRGLLSLKHVIYLTT